MNAFDFRVLDNSMTLNTLNEPQKKAVAELMQMAAEEATTKLTEDNRLLKEELDTKNAAAMSALDQIRKLYGLAEVTYPGQVVVQIEEILGKWICGICDEIFDRKEIYLLHHEHFAGECKG